MSVVHDMFMILSIFHPHFRMFYELNLDKKNVVGLGVSV